MKAKLLVLLAGIAFGQLEPAAVAQTLMNPNSFRGVPTFPGPVGGSTGPIGGAPALEPMKLNLTPTLTSVPTPTINQPDGLQDVERDVSKLPVPPTPPPEPGPDGGAERPDASGIPLTLDLSLPSRGQGGDDLAIPSTSHEPRSSFSRWIWIAVGVLAFLFYAGRRGRRG